MKRRPGESKSEFMKRLGSVSPFCRERGLIAMGFKPSQKIREQKEARLRQLAEVRPMGWKAATEKAKKRTVLKEKYAAALSRAKGEA